MSYCNETNITVNFSSPRYPQSNGLAEKGVAIAKNLLKRCYATGDVQTFQYRLLEYNTTPVASMGHSPAQLFFGRRLKSRLPISNSLLVRNYIDESHIAKKIQSKRQCQKAFYDRSSKTLPILNVGDTVIFKKEGKEWNNGQIIRQVNSRSYVVQDVDGNHFRRNRRLIVKTTRLNQQNDETEVDIAAQCSRNNSHTTERLETEASESSTDEESESEFYYTASDSETSEHQEQEGNNTESNEPCINNSEVNEPCVDRQYVTRSGRAVRPPVVLDL